MSPEKQAPRIREYFNRLYTWEWGYFVLSAVIGICVILLGALEGQRSVRDLFVLAIAYGPFLTGIGFLIRKYGWQGFAEKTILVTITILIKSLDILLIPLRIVFNIFVTTPSAFLFHRVHDALPEILRPLYRFVWYLAGAGIAYYLCWQFFIVKPNPKDFGSINLGYASYPFVIAGAEIAGVILFFCFLDVVPAYLGMFFNLLGKFKWQIRLVFYR